MEPEEALWCQPCRSRGEQRPATTVLEYKGSGAMEPRCDTCATFYDRHMHKMLPVSAYDPKKATGVTTRVASRGPGNQTGQPRSMTEGERIGAERPVRRSPMILHTQPEPGSPAARMKVLLSAGGAVLGVTAVIAGIICRATESANNNLCNTGLGTLAQEYSGHARVDCAVAGFVADMGTILIVVGVMAIIGGGLAAIAGIYLNNHPDGKTPAAQAARQVLGPDKPQAGQFQAGGSIVVPPPTPPAQRRTPGK